MGRDRGGNVPPGPHPAGGEPPPGDHGPVQGHAWPDPDHGQHGVCRGAGGPGCVSGGQRGAPHGGRALHQQDLPGGRGQLGSGMWQGGPPRGVCQGVQLCTMDTVIY